MWVVVDVVGRDREVKCTASQTLAASSKALSTFSLENP